jgi:hypothetical protein
MSGFSTDLTALDDCRRKVLREAGQFGGIADGFTARRAGASIFGTFSVAASLAALTGQVDTAATSELDAAQRLLRGVERALDVVHQHVSETESANVTAAQTIS